MWRVRARYWTGLRDGRNYASLKESSQCVIHGLGRWFTRLTLNLHCGSYVRYKTRYQRYALKWAASSRLCENILQSQESGRWSPDLSGAPHFEDLPSYRLSFPFSSTSKPVQSSGLYVWPFFLLEKDAFLPHVISQLFFFHWRPAYEPWVLPATQPLATITPTCFMSRMACISLNWSFSFVFSLVALGILCPLKGTLYGNGEGTFIFSNTFLSWMNGWKEGRKNEYNIL